MFCEDVPFFAAGVRRTAGGIEGTKVTEVAVRVSSIRFADRKDVDRDLGF